MRIIYTLYDLKKAHQFSNFLHEEGIENQLEVINNSDWGSPNYGDVTCKIWVYNEDQVETAIRWVGEFEKNSQLPIFQETKARSFPLPFGSEKEAETKKEQPSPDEIDAKDPYPLGRATLYILILCCVLFLVSMLTAPNVTHLPKNIPPTPLLLSAVKKPLMFDYPYAYEIIDQLVRLFGVDKLQDLEELPQEAKALFEEFQNTPYWKGIYPQISQWLQNPNFQWNFTTPMFEKIQKGEFWRFITPCFLHSDFLHLFFNMIWLIVLGKQMEKKIGTWRYLLFIVIIATISNTAQYLMSGPNFIGFSGVLCGMLTFIWMRQRLAAWEGYLLEGSTMAFMAFFILTMAALQLVSFYLETYKSQSFSTVIANTAHLAGAFCGLILGRIEFFALKLR